MWDDVQHGDISNKAAPRGVVVFEYLLGHPPHGPSPASPRPYFGRRPSWTKYIRGHEIDEPVIFQVHRLRELHDMTMDLTTLYPPAAQPQLCTIATQQRWPFGRVYATTAERLTGDPSVGRIYVSAMLDVALFRDSQTTVSYIVDPTRSLEWV